MDRHSGAAVPPRVREVVLALALPGGRERPTLDEVAAESGTPAAELHAAFGSLGGLVAAVVAPLYHEIEAALNDLPVLPVPSPAARRRTLEAVLQPCLRHLEESRLLLGCDVSGLSATVEEWTSGITYHAGVRLVGADFDTDPIRRAKALACLGAIGYVAGSGILRGPNHQREVDGLLEGLVALTA